MVQKLKNGRGAVARFGGGTVRINPYTLKTRMGGQVELTQCYKAAVGSSDAKTIPQSNKIVLDFDSVESLDVLIEKLQDLREDMIHDYNLE